MFVVDYWLAGKLARTQQAKESGSESCSALGVERAFSFHDHNAAGYDKHGQNSLWSLTTQVQMLVLPPTAFMILAS